MKKAIGIDLFSGAGGLSLGAELAGISVLYAVELDRDAAQTYKLNHPKTTIINQNIRDVSIIIREKDIPIVLFGGPPCQGFSTSNQRTRSKTNPQNWLFQEMMRIAKEIEPEWIVIENVKGIKETEKGFFFDSIKQSLDELGYNHEAIVLRASDFGVPQTRTRLFTKLSTIAVGLVALENSKTQVLYPIPEVYNSDYCEASDNYRIIELKDFSVFQ